MTHGTFTYFSRRRGASVLVISASDRTHEARGRFRADGAGGRCLRKFLTDRTCRLATADPPAAAPKPRALTGLWPLIVAGSLISSRGAFLKNACSKNTPTPVMARSPLAEASYESLYAEKPASGPWKVFLGLQNDRNPTPGNAGGNNLQISLGVAPERF
jgi:hypothetical protein